MDPLFKCILAIHEGKSNQVLSILHDDSNAFSDRITYSYILLDLMDSNLSVHRFLTIQEIIKNIELFDGNDGVVSSEKGTEFLSCIIREHLPWIILKEYVGYIRKLVTMTSNIDYLYDMNKNSGGYVAYTVFEIFTDPKFINHLQDMSIIFDLFDTILIICNNRPECMYLFALFIRKIFMSRYIVVDNDKLLTYFGNDTDRFIRYTSDNTQTIQKVVALFNN